MNGGEFRDWFEFHKTVFPGVISWLRRHGMKANEIVGFWQQVLTCVEVEEAKTASTRLYELEAQPKSYERHPAEIKRLCRKSSNQEQRLVSGPRFDGTVSCRRCLDEGLITVFYIRDSKAFDATTIAEYVLSCGDEEGLRTACVRCDCATGERFTSHPVWRDFCLISVGSKTWRKETRFWETVGDNRPQMAGANQTQSAAELAKSGAF